MDITLYVNAKCIGSIGSFEYELIAWGNNRALKIERNTGGSHATSVYLMYIVAIRQALDLITRPCAINVILPFGLVTQTVSDWINGTGTPSANHINRALSGLRKTIAQKGVILQFEHRTDVLGVTKPIMAN